MRLYLIGFCFLFACTSTETSQIRKHKEDLYCNVQSKIVTESESNKTTNQSTKTIVTCDDGPDTFMKKSGLARDCHFFTWRMPFGNTFTEQRSISCKRLDGGYEILPDYSLQY